MRTVPEAEKHWRQLDDFHSLTDLKIHVSSHKEPQITAGLRSVCWKSPWVALRADEALRAEIFQDIERCMPDNVYFRQPGTQDMMLDILFVWCKMHPGIGYRQGMHEILAPLLWVVERDAVERTSASGQPDPLLMDMLDSSYIEHDSHALFSLIMQTAKSFYAPAETGSTTKDTPMLTRSSRIFDKFLPKVDPPAYTLIKDALYLRDNLTPEGGAEIISRYGKQAPAIEPEAPTFIRESSPSPSLSSHRTRRSIGSPISFVGQQGSGLEAMLQGAAKNVFERGSQWGVGKAIREAVGEVKKNVEAYQSAANSGHSTPRAGGREFRKPAQSATPISSPRPGLDRNNSANVARKVEGLEKRNRNLAKMLETVVGELWEHHRERTEEHSTQDEDAKGKEALEALSLAIAKVQFVQVYLEDSSIPLPEESTEQAASEKAAETLALPAPATPLPDRTPSTPRVSVDAPSEPAPAPISAPESIHSPAPSPRPMTPPVVAKPAQPQPNMHLSPRSRPHLTSSNFSWMLGEDSATSNFASGTAHSTFSSDEKRRMKGKGFLFGDEDEDDSSIVKDSKRGSVAGKSGKSTKSKHVPEHEVEEEIIDLDNMEKRGVL
ncbi:hypothetical protein SNOG_11706 [Parastagonospora nodorum SN15]|uniref:Rab-GAP TBC domain-containing protein n=1 Tax=Phaeosphaeria nodorum (strain SN15 / ATCC MYA-4574 / FGSC 10173) TaxID=321614 RepID=Q0U958_PHANO|nr:hypothetical protein SNOG_11706 [Parastagonospora nodorum SN15]EAT80750.2 hypothetical protein SNOG_11706 [Parastagonospora nodorum SN15]